MFNRRAYAIATGILVICVALSAGAQTNGDSRTRLLKKLHTERLSPSDLEISGDVAGASSGGTHYLARADLLELSQVSFIVKDDPNFTRPTHVKGIPLEELVRDLAAEPAGDLVIAICDDKYRAHYPRVYLTRHRPLLVLEIEGKPPSGWPRDPEGHADMGPYMITNPEPTPAFKILGQSEEPQIPWGVVRLEFRDEKTVFGPIAPRTRANDADVKAGFEIAQQNCFRCHNSGAEGGQKSGVNWNILAALAATSPDFFVEYVRDPRAKNPNSQMAPNPNYGDAVTRALIAYFKTFAAAQKP